MQPAIVFLTIDLIGAIISTLEKSLKRGVRAHTHQVKDDVVIGGAARR
jgi:hypothetical protein